ncbi:hypothetical protein T459_18827 [Capsicum annuum]|uniref:MIF4G domain-containing protein n=1 Tax=Capsicum annuum TaxID=4072 RepID=A0A2G2Z0B0_CAPAN|nr:hypothetical protein T459_18827 [Capsicum annuum]
MHGKATYNTPLWWGGAQTPRIAVALVHRAALFFFLIKIKQEFEAELYGEDVSRHHADNNGVISLIFDKAALEPTFCPMYAQLCSYLNEKLTPFPSTDEPGGEEITFEHVLLNNCDEAYEGAEFSEQSK